MRPPGPLLVVTDRHAHARPLADTVAACLDGGADWIWFRERDMEPGERARLGATVARVVRRGGGSFLVGGDADLAAAIGADGVHLPGGSGEAAIARARATLPAGCRVGVSAHDPAEVAARRAGADYATISPVFASASKPGYGPALGLAGLAHAAGHGLPVLALGGVDAAAAASCRAAGASGLAVMGAAMRAANPAEAVRACRAAWDAAEAPGARDDAGLPTGDPRTRRPISEACNARRADA